MDLTKYGYDATVSRLTNYMRSSGLWSSVYQDASAQAFIRMYAWMTENLTFIDEETKRDLKFGSSTSLQAILEHVKIVGYPARKNQPSEMTVRFSVDAILTQSVTIPKWTLIKVGDLYFVTVAQAQLISGRTYVDVDVIQGFREQTSFISTGLPDSVFDVVKDKVSNDYIYVYVDGVEWIKTTSFYGETDVSEVYYPRTIYGGVRVEFGDGIFGAIPPQGNTILVDYLVCEGADGNLNTSGTAGEVIDILYAPNGAQVSMSVVTTTTAVGGQDEETVAEIKRNVPPYNTSGGVYKRRSELETIFLDYAEVDQVHIVTEADKASHLRDMRLANIINVYIVPEDGYTLDESTKANLIQPLLDEEKVLMNVTFNLEEATYLNLHVEVAAQVPDTVSYANKQNTLEQRLADFYADYIFGKDHLLHLLTRALSEELNIDGDYIRDVDLSNLRVDIFVIETQSQFEGWWDEGGFVVEEDFDDLLENGIFSEDYTEIDPGSSWLGDIWQKHTAGGTLQKYPIVNFAVEIDGVQETALTATGAFLTVNVQGNVNFTTGVYEITVSGAVTGVVTVKYQYNDEDIALLPEEFPILYSSKVTAGVEVDL